MPKESKKNWKEIQRERQIKQQRSQEGFQKQKANEEKIKQSQENKDQTIYKSYE